MMALALAGSARAQDGPAAPVPNEARADSVAPSDLVRSVPVEPGTKVVQVPRRDGRDARPTKRGLFAQPRFVMLRSLVFPGWGQLSNRQWIKAGVLAGAEIWLITALIRDDRELGRLQSQVDAARAVGDDNAANLAIEAYNDRLDRYVARQWLLGGVIVYAMVDAYVDAHFRDFDIEFQPIPPTEDGAPGDVGARLGLRWSF